MGILLAFVHTLHFKGKGLALQEGRLCRQQIRLVVEGG
jgi:hypothetical protein